MCDLTGVFMTKFFLTDEFRWIDFDGFFDLTFFIFNIEKEWELSRRADQENHGFRSQKAVV